MIKSKNEIFKSLYHCYETGKRYNNYSLGRQIIQLNKLYLTYIECSGLSFVFGCILVAIFGRGITKLHFICF